jgi:4-alpha-glucanotransferase
MNDAAIRQLARRAGIAEQWLDYTNKPRRVSLDTIRRILTALDLPCATADDLAHSRHLLDSARPSPLITATVGRPIALPIPVADDAARFHLIDENGTTSEITTHRSGRGLCLSGVQSPGYYTLALGQARVTVAVAPARCHTIDDSAPGKRLAGLVAQTYGLRSDGDCGIGDMAAVTALTEAAAAVKIDALALSPAHALFAADPRHSSPYSPSNRLFYNPLIADPGAVLGADRVARARTTATLGAAVRESEVSPLIDWTVSSNAKMSVLRYLFDDFVATDLAASPPTKLAEDFVKYCAARGAALEQHA